MKSIINFIEEKNINTLRFGIVGIVLLFFSNTLFHQFVYDDRSFVLQEGVEIESSISTILSGKYPLPQTGVYRPVRGVVYAFAESLFYGNSFLYHLFVVLLHGYVSVLVFDIAKKMTKSKTSATIAAVLFAIHPLHVESVAWITAGFDLVFIIFYLLSFKFYIKKEISHNKKWALFFGILAYFSNELALTLPLILLIHDVIEGRKISYIEKNIAPYIFGAIGYWMIRVNVIEKFVETSHVYGEFFNNILLSGIIFGKYIFQIIFPISLSIDPILYQGMTAQFSLNQNPTLIPPKILAKDMLPLVLAIMLILFSFHIFKIYIKEKKVGIFFWWIPITLLPVLQIIPFTKIYADRYAYLSTVGFSIIIGSFFSIYQKKKYKQKIIFLGFAAYLLFFGYKTVKRNMEWKNEKILWGVAYQQNPQSLAAINGLGYVYSEEGNQEMALEYFEKAYKVNPFVEKYQKNILISYRYFNMHEKVIEVILHIKGQKSLDYSLLFMLGEAHESQGDKTNAKIAYKQAIKISKNNQAAKDALKRLSD